LPIWCRWTATRRRRPVSGRARRAWSASYDNKAYPLRRNAPEQRALFWWLWPTTTFNVLPGSPAVGVFSYMPGGAGITVTHGDRYAVPGNEFPAEDNARIEYSRNILNPEDVALCESVQRGLASRCYSQGRFVADPAGSVITEQAVHHFHRLVAQAWICSVGVTKRRLSPRAGGGGSGVPDEPDRGVQDMPRLFRSLTVGRYLRPRGITNSRGSRTLKGAVYPALVSFFA
jgi:hypothetical protein